MQQIAMTGFHINKLKANFAHQLCRGDIRIDQFFQIVIGPDDRVIIGIKSVLFGQQRMVIRNARLEVMRVWTTKATGVCQLCADQQVIGRAEVLAMGGLQCFAQTSN